ncbi:MAG: hypothetical protein II817_07235 [Bacteroidales bacterium]|nr:hypothetical protein [Bacteroidales bacterium]
MNGQNALAIISNETLSPASLSQAVREAGVVTVRQSIESGFPSINKIVKELGYKETAVLMVAHIVKLETMLNVSRPMQPEAMAEVAKGVIDACLESGININAADIEIVFKRARQGAYGAFYGGIGSADILGWFDKYISEKAEEYVQYNIEKSQQYDTGDERSYDRAKAKDREAHRAAAEYFRQSEIKKHNNQKNE